MSTNPDPDLMRIFDFTAEDLEMNRAGRLSERQAQKLSEKGKTERFSHIFGGIIISVLMLVIITRISQMDLHMIQFWAFILLFLLILVLIGNYVAGKSLAADIKSGTIYFAQGTIKRWQGRGGGRIEIANKLLDIDQMENNSLKKYLQKIPKETQFRVSFTPKTKMVVSMEIITP